MCLVSILYKYNFADPVTEILGKWRFTKNFTILDETGSQSMLRRAGLAQGSQGASWKVEKSRMRILSIEMEKPFGRRALGQSVGCRSQRLCLRNKEIINGNP